MNVHFKFYSTLIVLLHKIIILYLFTKKLVVSGENKRFKKREFEKILLTNTCFLR